MIVSFALAFLIAASFGQRVNVAALAIGSLVALVAATALGGVLAGLAAVAGLQTGYLAGHAALMLQAGAVRAAKRESADRG